MISRIKSRMRFSTICIYLNCNTKKRKLLFTGAVGPFQNKGRQRIRCQADKINLHSHNPFPDIIGKQTAYTPHEKQHIPPVQEP